MKKKTQSFTQREKDVLKLLLLGYSNKDISAKLFITESTVKAHLTSVYKKLGVNGRTKAMAKLSNSNLHPNSEQP